MIRKLESLTPKELEELKRQTKGKRAVLVVHPFFGNSTGFEKFLKNTRFHNQITIVAEGHEKQTELVEKLQRIAGKGRIILYYNTKNKSTPIPCIGWQRLIKKLEFAGIQKLQIGGHLLGDNHKTIVVRKMLEGLVKSRIHMKDDVRLRKETTTKIDRQRTVLRGAKELNSTVIYDRCAGYTASKLASSGKFRVRITRRFSR